MNLMNSMNRLRIKKNTTTTTNIYTNDGSQLTGWTTSGSVTITNSLGNPTPSISVPNGTNCYYRVPGITSFKGRTIQFNMYTASLINLYFACNSNGAGQMFRLETRGGSYSGFTSTTSWTSWTAPGAGMTLTVNTWYTIRITINSSGGATYTYNGVAGPGGSGSYTIPSLDDGTYTYIGIVGDGISGGYVDNIVIT